MRSAPVGGAWRTQIAGVARHKLVVHPSGGNATCLDDQGVPFQLWQPAVGY